MILVSTKVGPFRSMNTMQEVVFDPTVTVFVGMNEAGKTVLLKALQKSSDALGEATFDPIEDYPRKDLSAYLKRHSTAPVVVTVLTFALSDAEISEANRVAGTAIKPGFQVTVSYKYDNTQQLGFHVDEAPVLKALAKTFSTDAAYALKDCGGQVISDILISFLDAD